MRLWDVEHENSFAPSELLTESGRRQGGARDKIGICEPLLGGDICPPSGAASLHRKSSSSKKTLETATHLSLSLLLHRLPLMLALMRE